MIALEQAVSAPLCTKHLADLGADVIKVERTGVGDFARAYDSVVRGQSAYFVWLNQGKRSIALDLKDPRGREDLEFLVASADVLIHNVGPRTAAGLGLTWTLVHESWPRLILCAISGYGSTGPYRDRKAYDLLLQGESGLISLTGTEDQPAKVGISIVDIAAGMYAFASVLAALYDRNVSGEARSIEISMLDCIAEWMSAPVFHQRYGERAPARAGLRHNMIVPYGPYAAKDGAVNVAVQSNEHWRRFCASVLEDPHLGDDPRYATNELRVRERKTLEPLIESALSRFTRNEVLERMDGADLPSGALNTVAELVRHPQLKARGRWRDIPTPAGTVTALRHPMEISGLPQMEGRVPSLDEHHRDVILSQAATKERR